MSLRGIATVNVWADDPEAAAAWYAEVFGVEPYFRRPGPDGATVYVEFRVGDHQHEWGIIDSRFRPPALATGAGGAVVHWHVDDLEKTVARLQELGARELQPITPHGDSGFVAASVVDPFGNVLGVMMNPHYLEMLAGAPEA
ncbi:VOC family protein [Nocardioides sp. SYSU DS0663]|uniref:VOC family protein n=1 Tax=Nocardioides sp. SYSU DS0663 TaxID=3416445 RepID=UPI003F4C4354